MKSLCGPISDYVKLNYSKLFGYIDKVKKNQFQFFFLQNGFSIFNYVHLSSKFD